MSAISGNSPSQPTPLLSGLRGTSALQMPDLDQLLKSRGDSDWHFDLKQTPDKLQATAVLTGFYHKLAGKPELLAQLSQLPHGQALIECLEDAACGRLDQRNIHDLQTFLSETAGIDISYGGGNGMDGLLGPRTLTGLQTFFNRLEPSTASAPVATNASQGISPASGTVSHYLSSLELNTREPKMPVLTSLSLFSDTAPSGVYERSPYHDDNKFVPRFAMAAYHESGVYRSPRDPYAVGAISRPRRRDDLGGKTYGTYQFESSVHTSGASDPNKVANSTLMRFLKWSGNPYGQQLREAAQRHGFGSAAFDQVWAQLAREHNKIFGEAQQAFMLSERSASVKRFMNKAELSPEVQQDARIQDLIMGTTNHVGGLADSAADHLARIQRQQGRKLTANEAGRALAEYKETRIATWFQSSPGAWNGLRNRFQDERSQFA